MVGVLNGIDLKRKGYLLTQLRVQEKGWEIHANDPGVSALTTLTQFNSERDKSLNELKLTLDVGRRCS